MQSDMPNPQVGYEIFVVSFCDSDQNGIGDLRGIISQLAYLKDLGIDCIWLTPMHPSPSYHKYDVTDYYNIDPSIGTIDDYKVLIKEAHALGIQVLMDLVINHTSDQHLWFKEALKQTENDFHEFYIWMHPEEIEARGIAFREGSHDTAETEPWHSVDGQQEKYYGAFWKGMPDLNFKSDKLKNEIRKIIHFWLIEIGVDGFRMDAARHIFPHWEKDKNPGFWEEFKTWIAETGKPCMTIGEVWAKTEETAPYLKGLDSLFNFDLYFLIQQILTEEKDPDLVSNLNSIYNQYSGYNTKFTDAIFLSNHDQNRISASCGNNREKLKLAASILLTLPGLPIIYYGEELGMLGQKPDPFIREPFLWSDNPHDTRITKVIDPCYSTPETVGALSQQINSEDSVFNHYKRLIALRKSEPSMASITNYNIQSREMKDPELLAFIRPHALRPVLVIHNLSKNNKTIHDIQVTGKVLFCNSLFSISSLDEIILSAYSSIIVIFDNTI